MPTTTVDYDTLDKAKNAFIAAAKSTLTFAEKFGFVPRDGLGASANLFALNLKPFLTRKDASLYMSLVPEGLGTADDTRPEDLTSDELKRFWFNIGIKTVAVMTNDVATSGLQTILIGLYLPSSTPETVFTPEFMRGFLDGVVQGCLEVGCVYLSGETPQLKTKIVPNRLDIAGAAFGVLTAGNAPVDSSALQVGDKIVFVESSGPHENGFTTLRELADRLPQGYRTKMSDGKEFWEGMNAPSKLYTPLIQEILRSGVRPTNIENITGHGWQKLMRPKQPFSYLIQKTLPVPPVFKLAEQSANLSPAEMIKIFNYGAGLALFARSESDAECMLAIASKLKLKAIVAGKVEKSTAREVIVEPFNAKLEGEKFLLKKG